MNLNDQQLEIDTIRNYRIHVMPQKDFLFFNELFIHKSFKNKDATKSGEGTGGNAWEGEEISTPPYPPKTSIQLRSHHPFRLNDYKIMSILSHITSNVEDISIFS